MFEERAHPRDDRESRRRGLRLGATDAHEAGAEVDVAGAEAQGLRHPASGGDEEAEVRAAVWSERIDQALQVSGAPHHGGAGLVVVRPPDGHDFGDVAGELAAALGNLESGPQGGQLLADGVALRAVLEPGRDEPVDGGRVDLRERCLAAQDSGQLPALGDVHADRPRGSPSSLSVGD
ncbi:MAG: hypothetical protein WKG00_14905 [Polyangiaceae bacterium]